MAAQHTFDSLIDAALDHYRSKGWTASKSFTGPTKKVVQSLTTRPQLVAKHDGMEHLIFAFGQVKDSTFKLIKQVLFDLELKRNAYHVVISVDKPVKQTDERLLKEMGVGVLQIRIGASAIQLVPAHLRCFRVSPTLERVPSRLRSRVRGILRQIREEDVCVGILDLTQVLEKEIDRICAMKRTTPNTGRPPALGTLIGEARGLGILTNLVDTAAGRVNKRRSVRAHPRTDVERRRLVSNAESIVEDCLAVLFAINGR